MNLASVAVGAEARIQSVSTESALALRLREMGVRPGAAIRVAGKAPAGARVIAIGAARIAMDRATCLEIEVVGA
ncbi:FeoA family protein [Demequina sp.]|uniref:FeoA family protein n=1 Tax=Demequina sp. TaxID=2050685 RepID=UPI003A84FDA3